MSLSTIGNVAQRACKKAMKGITSWFVSPGVNDSSDKFL